MILELREDQDFQSLLERSKTDPILIFKHSTQCSISSQAYDELERFRETSGVTCGVVLVIEDRRISNAIAESLGIRHESPQAIVIKNGRPIWNASHWSITAESLNEVLLKHAKSTGS
jgi:bacillithiol system protein YtxJ